MDDEELTEIRRRKREQLEAKLRGETPPESGGVESPSEPVHVNGAAELSDVTSKYDVVLADFYADWCGPCKMLEPIVEDIAAETSAAVAKVDVDANQQLAAQYQVQGVPTMMLFAGGEPVERVVGVRDKHELTRLVEQHGGS